MRRRARPIVGVLGWVVVIAVVAGWFAYLRPPALGGRTAYVFIKGDSMEPTYHTGDLVLVRRQADYAVGDVAAFTVAAGGGETIVIHRIRVAKPDGTYLLRGDNRDEDDPWQPDAEGIVGTPFGLVPALGTFVARLAARPVALGLLCALIAGLSVGLGRDDPSPSDDEPHVGEGASTPQLGPTC